MREIALDTETTGLDPYTGHRVVEIGCVEMINHIRTGHHFHVYLNPERDMPKEAEQVHGLSANFLKDKPLFRSIADAFLEFLGESPLIIHNAAFDMKFINAELERVGYPVLPMARATDTVIMARKKFPGQPASLDALCKRFGVDLSARTKHGALLDAELLAEIYLELRGGRQTGLVLESQREVPRPSETRQTSASAVPQVARHFALSPEEEQEHNALLNRLKNPMWRPLLEGAEAS